MILYGIPDIRLFWTKDTGFLSQFEQLSPDDEIKYKQISKQPQLEMDLSFWLPDETTIGFTTESLRADVYDVIRLIGGDLIEQVYKNQIKFHNFQTKLYDEFESMKKGRKSQTYRITYRSMERPLSKDEVNVIHKQIERHLAEKFGIQIR